MNKFKMFSTILVIFIVPLTLAATNTLPCSNQSQSDSTRIAELDLYWEQLNATVMAGDFESYKELFHDDAVIIFASGSNKTSVPITTALAGWKQGFNNTKEGKTTVNVTCRFSQRIGDATTAHESGIFIYSSTDNSSKKTDQYFIPFEMLLVKRDNKWLGLMEHQKPYATQKEWDDLRG